MSCCSSSAKLGLILRWWMRTRQPREVVGSRRGSDEEVNKGELRRSLSTYKARGVHVAAAGALLLQLAAERAAVDFGLMFSDAQELSFQAAFVANILQPHSGPHPSANGWEHACSACPLRLTPLALILCLLLAAGAASLLVAFLLRSASRPLHSERAAGAWRPRRKAGW